MRLDSFFAWVGGKKALREVIVKKFPLNYDRYVEVFGGAGWVLFHKPPEAFEVYNDFNSNLTNMYYVVKHKTMQFLEELGFLPLNSRSEFAEIRKLIMAENFEYIEAKEELEVAKKYLDPLSLAEYEEILKTKIENRDVRRAVLFYKLIRYSYANGTKSFGNQPTNIINVGKHLWAVNRRLNSNGVYDVNLNMNQDGKGVVIENKDCVALIEQYDRESTFFYLDPPYYMTEKCYDAPFQTEDHVRLRDALKNIKGKFMVSYNKCDFICELYKDFEITVVKRLNNISQRYDAGNMYEEVIITNYPQDERENAHRQLQLDIFQ